MSHLLVIRENTNVMHRAREAFVESESSERIRRALRHNIRTYSDEIYENGEVVYYRVKNYKGWKGPATVFGRDGQCILVKHGSVYRRVHPWHMMKKRRHSIPVEASVVRSEERKPETKLCGTPFKRIQGHTEDVAVSDDEEIDADKERTTDHEDEDDRHRESTDHDSIEVSDCEEVDVDTITVSAEDNEDEGEDLDDNPVSEAEIESDYEGRHDEADQSANSRDTTVQVQDVGSQDVDGYRSVEDKETETRNENEEEEIVNSESSVLSSKEYPKNKSCIQLMENGVWKEAKVLSKQPKKTSKYKEWLNIHVKGEEESRSRA